MPDFFVPNDQGYEAVGDVASLLLNNNFDPRMLRRYITNGGFTAVDRSFGPGEDGKEIVKSVMLQNAAATLRRDEWLAIDRAVTTAARPLLRFVQDLRAGGLTYPLANAMGKTALTWERQSNIAKAQISMDGLRRGDADRPLYDSQIMPLPLIHKDFHFSTRQIAQSRNGDTPMDTTTAAMAGQMVAEEAEKLALGVLPSYSYGGGSVYGLLNYPDSTGITISSPWNTDGTRNPAWTSSGFKNEIQKMKSIMLKKFKYGPYVLYHSPDWDDILDDDYNSGTSGLASSITTRKRILEIDGISGFRSTYFLPERTMVMLQMDSTTIELIDGMDITTIQWPSEGGFQVNFKVIAMILPRLKSDYYKRTGIVHAVAISP